MFAILFLYLLTPTCLLHSAAFLLLAAGAGLHLPTLLAGQLLHAVLGGLGAAEPVLLVGLLVWAGHKMLVRRRPLVDGAYWRGRMAGWREEVVNSCNNHRR